MKDARLIVAGVRAALADRAAADHGHEIGQVAGLQTALDAKAPLDGPAFSGVPTAPTPDPDDDSTRLATTAFVAEATAGLGDVPAHTHPVSDLEGLPKTGWANPDGAGYNKGAFNADDETAISDPPTGAQVTELQNRLKDTRAVLRALILELKTIGLLAD